MEDNNNTKAMQSVLRLFEEHRQDVEDPSRRDWKWREGTLLFPEGKCCYCNAPVRSNRLWVVDQGWLRGQLNIDEAVFEKPDHPHSGTDGGLCLGDSDDPVNALFFGVNPSDPLRRDMSIGKWYERMFGHVCGSKEALALKASELFPANCGGREDDDDEEDYCDACCRCCDVDCCQDRGICDCGCDNCYCRRSYCFKCRESIGENYAQVLLDDVDPDYWQWYCQKCWSEVYEVCPRCLVHRFISEMEVEGDTKCCKYCAAYLRRFGSTPTVAVSATTAPATMVVNTADSTSAIEVTPEMIEAAVNQLQTRDD